MRLGAPRHIAWAGGVLVAAIVLLAAYDIFESYTGTVERTGRELQTQAQVIAEQTARSVQAIDVVLRHVASEYSRGRLAQLNAEELHNFLRELVVGLNQIDGLGLFDARGEALGVSWPAPRKPPNMAHLPRFQALRDDPNAGFVVFEAAPAAGDAVWIVPFARRLETPSGEFAGVVAARGRVDYFQQVYRDAYPDAASRVALLHRNTTLLARHPPANEALGRKFPIVESLLAAAALGKTFSRNTSPLDGVDRFGVIRSVPEYGLVAIVTRDAAAALAPWRRQTTGTVLRTLALGALAAALLWLLSRQFARLEATRRSLEETQNRFALAVAGSDDGIWEHDYERGRAFNSSRARELVGMPPGPEELELDDWLATLPAYQHPEDVPRRQAAMQAHLAGRTPIYEVDVRHRQPDGAYRWVRIRGICVRDAEGGPLRMAGSVSDIDARKRAEESLRASEEQYRAIFNGAADALVLRDAEARVVDVNPAFLRMMGYTRDEIVGTHWTFSGGEPSGFSRSVHERVIAGESLHFELTSKRKDGSPIELDVRAVPLRHLGRPHTLGMARDITAQKHAAEALRASEERYQLAVAGANQGLWDWDLGTDTMFLSARAQEFMGLEPAEPLRPRREWIALSTYHPDDIDAVRAAMSDHLHGRSAFYAVDYRLRHPSGNWHWYRQRGVALRDAAGRPYRMAGSMEDITAQKDLEGQLLQAKKLEAIGTLAGGIAHDFNNILAAILGYGEMAQKSAGEGSALRRHVDAVVSAGLRAKSLVERILAFSRSGIGERKPVHVQSVVAEALDLVVASLPRHVELERALGAADAAVLGDATQIHQVVMNLCANGAQAMKSRGTLAVSLDVADKPAFRAATSALPAGRYVRLAVRDTGTGISPKLLERIFDPFFTTKDVGVGTGLGLSLVHGIVTDLGGGIAVESRPGEGSIFTVYLPHSRAVAAAAPSHQALPEGSGETVLIVDDEEPLVRLSEEMIAGLGYEPVGFSSSPAALESFRASPERFHAVLTDESMPELTGSELAREIRRLRPDIPILMMSGVVTPALSARARELGAEVLAKPLAERDLARILAAAVHSMKGEIHE